MTKDEMKNRISMALKDPVLQQGFEIICHVMEHDYLNIGWVCPYCRYKE